MLSKVLLEQFSDSNFTATSFLPLLNSAFIASGHRPIKFSARFVSVSEDIKDKLFVFQFLTFS